jgi:hypothetical protein
MPETMNVQYLNIPIGGNLVAGTALMPLVVAASAGLGGGFTLVGASFFAGALTGAGTAYTLALVHGGYQGTVNAGTVGGLIGGTASVFAADTVYPFTLTGTQTFAAGDSLTVRKVASGVNMTPTGSILLQIVQGR